MKTNLSVKNYYHPTPRKWRIIGDFALVLIPVINAAIPNMPLGDSGKYWLGFGASILLISAKFFTNLLKDDNESN